MYEQRFGLNRRPFPTTPHVDCYYPATPHEQALAPLLRALEQDEGLALLVGPAGSGKTLLAQILLDRMRADTDSAFLTNSHLPDRVSLLQAILYDLGLPYDEGREQILRLRLTEHCLKNCEQGRSTVVIVDEAQNLSFDVLEELRLLGNLEAGRKALQVVLLGQPVILETLKLPRLVSFNQRLAVRGQLELLPLEEAMDYIFHHLRSAGGKPEKIIDEEGLETLARGCQGTPRLLNQAGHQALTLADSAEADQIDAEIALEALFGLGLSEEPEEVEDVRGYEIRHGLEELQLRKTA